MSDPIETGRKPDAAPAGSPPVTPERPGKTTTHGPETVPVAGPGPDETPDGIGGKGGGI